MLSKKSFIIVGLFLMIRLGSQVNLLEEKVADICFLDVGQGDSILIETPQFNLLIDGGPDLSAVRELGSLLSYFNSTIDYLILTHAHQDHFAGLIDILKQYSVRAVLLTHKKIGYSAYDVFESEIQKIKVMVEPEQKIVLPLSDEVWIEVIYPLRKEDQEKKINNHSLIAKLRLPSFSILLTGDMEVSEEKRLTRYSDIEVRSDVLKVGHHGANTSSSLEFLQKVNPRVAIIEVGQDNPHGHPGYRVIKRLAKLKIPVLRTDRDGTIVFHCFF